MSANGAFSSTLDYTLIGGGVLQVKGPVSVSIDPTFVASATVPIYAELQPYTLDFSLDEAGIETPTIQASLNATIDFSASATAGQGIQSFLSSFYTNRIEFTANSEGFVIVSGTADLTLPLTTNTNIYVFSEGPASGSISFSLTSQAYNMTTRVRSRAGDNAVLFKTNEFNAVRVPKEANSVRIVDNGERIADIIQN
jgi:hypothetical protein